MYNNHRCEEKRHNSDRYFAREKQKNPIYCNDLSHEYLFIVCLFACTHNGLLLLFVCFSYSLFGFFFVQIGFHVNRKASGFNFENAFLIG